LVRCNTSPSIDDAENDTMSAEDLAALRTSSDEEGSVDEGDAALRRELQSLHGLGDDESAGDGDEGDGDGSSVEPTRQRLRGPVRTDTGIATAIACGCRCRSWDRTTVESWGNLSQF
jgi:hypothetical protein